ncbi:hypothetical protein H6CHR_02311 [Variovorax sp. PBL-H6]|uniref:DUF485 domain-containing protein n=1 Tax=Variovorax sp. PBL-H6 TaxID=434009 RepID=UPI001316CD4E|nr:DUF485 domain-containing protein [Variovorax sp. PBL-H6]VTU25027.1 hypothetical protein H6CHR_02311 [Variovorax sp. PBL-H6]
MGTPLTAPLSSPTSTLAPTPRAQDEHRRWREAMESRPFAQLLALKRRCITPLLAVSFTFIVVMTLLAGFAKDFMGQKVTGAFNVGYLLVLLTYLLCWAVALIYVHTANRCFDAQARLAIADFEARRPR